MPFWKTDAPAGGGGGGIVDCPLTFPALPAGRVTGWGQASPSAMTVPSFQFSISGAPVAATHMYVKEKAHQAVPGSTDPPFAFDVDSIGTGGTGGVPINSDWAMYVADAPGVFINDLAIAGGTDRNSRLFELIFVVQPEGPTSFAVWQQTILCFAHIWVPQLLNN